MSNALAPTPQIPAQPVQKPSNETSQPAWMPTAAFITGAIVLILFFILVGVLLSLAEGATESTWNRYMVIFGSAEAIVFAAAGFIFGREVNKKTAENAQQQADANADAKETAQEQQKQAELKAANEANRFKALRYALEDAQTPPSGNAALGLVEPPGESPAPAEAAQKLSDLKRFARALDTNDW